MIGFMDRCPTCRFNLGRHCFRSGLAAGDDVQCPDCREWFAVIEYDDGWESGFDFIPIDDLEMEAPAMTEDR